MNAFGERFSTPSPTPAPPIDGHEIVTDPAKAAQLLWHDDLIGLDIETTGLSPWRNQVATIQLYGDRTGTASFTQCLGGVVPPAIKDVLERPDVVLIAHNGAAFDFQFLRQAGVDVFRPSWYDTMIAEIALTTSGRRNISKSLRATTKRRLSVTLDKDTALRVGGWDAEELTLERVKYAMRDVLHLPALMRAQQGQAEEKGMAGGLAFEVAALKATGLMIANGMPLNDAALEEYRGTQRAIADESAAVLGAELPSIKNLNSVAQVKQALADQGIELTFTRAEILEELAQFGGRAGALANNILRYRHAVKRYGMYDQEWAAEHVQPDGRVHARYWQASTETTRYASSDPNLQQVPRNMRWCWGWEPDRMVVSGDYSQIEVKGAAFVAEDEKLLALCDAEDVHVEIACAVFGLAHDQVDTEIRRRAKAIVFTLLFGGGARRLFEYARQKGSSMTEIEAERYVTTFFSTFPGLARTRERAHQLCQHRRAVTLVFPSGLKRIVAGDNLRPTVLLNNTVQALAACGIKRAMVLAVERGLGSYLAAQVHDEIVLAGVPAPDVEDAGVTLTQCMEKGMEEVMPGVPSSVKLEIGPAWGRKETTEGE